MLLAVWLVSEILSTHDMLITVYADNVLDCWRCHIHPYMEIYIARYIGIIAPIGQPRVLIDSRYDVI